MTAKQIWAEQDRELRWTMAENRRISGQDKAHFCPRCGQLERKLALWTLTLILFVGLIAVWRMVV